MKAYLIIILLFFTLSSYSQSNSASSLIIERLSLSQDTISVNTLKKDLKTAYQKYKVYFNFIPSINPLNPKRQKRVSSKFGKRFHPIDKKVKAHQGLDISAALGTPIHAAASGTIIQTLTSDIGYGNKVTIKHMYGYTTVYAHMYLYVVKKNLRVKKGDIIGYVGNSGKSTAPHLHYEIRKNNKPIDPYPFCFLSL